MEREQKRLEQFRRLRKEIRGSQDYLVVGIDISKDTHNALMRNTSGKILYRRLTFSNTGEGFETLLLQVEAGTVLKKWCLAWNPRRTITSRWGNS